MKAAPERKKYLLTGMAIGIVIGIAVFYLLMMSGLIRPPLFGDFARSGNLTNFTRPLRNAAGVP